MRTLTVGGHKIRIKCLEAHGTGAVRWVYNFSRVSSSLVSLAGATGDYTRGQTSGTSLVDILTHPGDANLQLRPQGINLFNRDNVDHTVQILDFDGTTSDELWQGTLKASGGSFTWTPATEKLRQPDGTSSDSYLIGTSSAALPATQDEVDGGGPPFTDPLIATRYLSPETFRNAQIPFPPPGGYYNLVPRGFLDAFMRYVTPHAGVVVPSSHYDNAFFGTPTYSTLAGVADRITFFPYAVSRDMTIDRIGVDVTTLLAGSNCKIAIYDMSSAYWPGSLMRESAAISCAATGYAFDNWSSPTFTFFVGTHYWIGVRFSATQTIRAIPTANALSLGMTAANATTHFNRLDATLAFATGAPSTWSYADSQRTTGVIPRVVFRVAP
jgi:hypothetical protein